VSAHSSIKGISLFKMAPQNIQGFKYILIAKYQVYLRSVGDLSWAKEPLFVNSY